MRRTTEQTLLELENAEWFASVGIRNEVSKVAVVLSSWEEAIEFCSSVGWENLELELANKLREKLLRTAIDRYRQWNQTAVELKAVTIPLVDRKIAPVVEQNRLPKAFRDAVQWDILHVCMEAEYTDVCPPGFYSGLAFWYVKGHFPCGWLDDSPQGRPIIY